MIKITNVIGVIQIRASIETKKELRNLIERLQQIWPHEDEETTKLKRREAAGEDVSGEVRPRLPGGSDF